MARAEITVSLDKPVLDYLIERAQAGNRADPILAALRELHAPVERDGPTPRECAHCIVGYDPKTQDLVHAAWPCTTAGMLDG